MSTDGERLRDRAEAKHLALKPEKLADFEDTELTLRRFAFKSGSYGNYVIMDCVDEDGVNHLLTTGGEAIIRILDQIDQEEELPLQVKFVKVLSGSGRKVWSIE